MTQFNHEQLKAINGLGNNIVVSASAGAGKTTVLIARLMKRIIEDNVRLDAICAMTFTEAAASEMKTRLLAALNNAYTENEDAFIAQQISLVETAQISTIHSFCLTIIKNYGYVLGIDPDRANSILDDSQVQILQNEAMDTTFRYWLVQEPDTMQHLLDTFSNNPIDFDGLKKAIQTIATWILSKKDPESAKKEVLNLYQAQSLQDFPKDIKDLFFTMYINNLESIKKEMMTLISISDAIHDPNDKKQEKFFTQTHAFLDLIESINAIQKQCSEHDDSFYSDLPNLFDFKIVPDSKDDNYTKTRNSLQKEINNLFGSYIPFEKAFEDLNNQASDIYKLLEITDMYLESYNQLKVEKNAFDFSDFESLALEILSFNDGIIAAQVRNIYQEIMVDEFQDTNETQDEIIRLISNGKNIFRVGDIKQSIYRFRGAKPKIMQSLMRDESITNLSLSYNYRSKKDIVDYNNIVFNNLMNLSYGISYSESDNVNVGLSSQAEDSYPVEFHIIERGSDKFKETSAQQQAQYISQEMIRYHKMGYKFKDMVVLVRSHTAKAPLKEALELANIPHYIDDRSGFYQSPIIQDILNLLNLVINPHDYYYIKVLGSTFFNYTPDMLGNLYLHESGSLRRALEALDPNTYTILRNAIYSWQRIDIVSVLQEIYLINDTYQRISLQEKTNLDFLLEKATQYQQNSIPSLLGFIRFIRTFENDISSEASPLSQDADVVTAMTIHQSKGLQFPIVFLWGMGAHKVFDHDATLLVDDSMGLALNKIDLPKRIASKNILRHIMETKQNHEEMEENLRLLYVALTRPQKHLIIIDSVREFKVEELSFSTLFNHKRKAELLYAASPTSTILKRIDANDIETEALETLEHVEEHRFTKLFDEEIHAIASLQNRDLDFNRYSQEGLSFGTTLHNAIESLPNRTWTSDDLDIFEDRYRDPLLRYNAHPFTQELYTFDTIEHEMPFIDSNGEGIIDFFAYNKTQLVLVDFKSDNISHEELINTYKSQISHYADILKQEFPNHQINAYIYSFKSNEYIQI